MSSVIFSIQRKRKIQATRCAQQIVLSFVYSMISLNSTFARKDKVKLFEESNKNPNKNGDHNQKTMQKTKIELVWEWDTKIASPSIFMQHFQTTRSIDAEMFCPPIVCSS